MSFADFFDMTTVGCRPNGGPHQLKIDCAMGFLERYCKQFTGIVFDLVPDNYPDRMTAADLYSVGSLSMGRFSGTPSVSKMLDRFDQDFANSQACAIAPCIEHFHCVLRRIPPTATVYDVQVRDSFGNLAWDQMRCDMEHLWQLIGYLVGVRNDAPANRTKPLARKRPALIPILDTAARKNIRAMGYRNGDLWDGIILEMQRDRGAISAGVTRLRGWGLPNSISELRVVDILVWMRHMGESCH